MKANLRIIAASLAVSLSLVSCSKQDSMYYGKTETLVGTRTITVSFACSDSKSELYGLQPNFAAGDIIKVSNGTDAPEDCVVSVDGGNASITTSLTGTLTAVYPASVWSDTDPFFNVPGIQNGTFAGSNICKATIGEGASAATFQNQTAVLRFYVDKSIGVKSIKIESTSDIATGAKIITVDPSGDTTLDEVTDDPGKRICYVSVLSGVNAGTMTLSSVTNTQGEVTRPKPMADVALVAGTIYNAFIPYYIDLGTAGKWGYCNVGAFLPEESGDYYMWGATVKAYISLSLSSVGTMRFTFGDKPGTYSNTTWDASKGFNVCNAPYTDGMFSATNKNVFTKYTADKNDYAKSGTADGKMVLDLVDDVANANWGGRWRMPEKEEFDALASLSITWDDTNKGSVIGSDDSRIFLPVAGYGNNTSLVNSSSGNYVSSSLNTSEPNYCCGISTYQYGELLPMYYGRNTGNSVRAVYE